MRPSLPALLAAVFVASCCATNHGWQVKDRSTPERAFETFRGAVLLDDPKEIYESMTPRFWSRHGVDDVRVFTIAYRKNADEFALVRRVLDQAEVKAVTPAPSSGGRRRVELVMEAYGRRGRFLLEEFPTVSVTVENPEEVPEESDYDRDWEGSVAIRDDEVSVVLPVTADELWVRDPSEIREIHLHRRWLLERILDLPVDLDALLGRRSGTPAGYGAAP